jgi:hypothetical protein
VIANSRGGGRIGRLVSVWRSVGVSEAIEVIEEMDVGRLTDSEVAPGLYLGVVFWGQEKILNFALDFGR